MKEKTMGLSVKLCVLCAAVLVLGSIQLILPDFYGTMWQLVMQGDLDGLTRYITSFGYAAVLISILMIVFANVTGLPSIPFLTVNGIIFGLVPGIVISWVGEVVGIEISFLLTRTLFRKQAKAIIERNNMLEKLDSYSCIRTMMMARSIPYSPNVLVTALGALSRISQRDHMFANLIGKIPPVIVEVWMGHDLLRFREYSGRLLIVAGIVVIVYGAIWWYYRRREAFDAETDTYATIAEKIENAPSNHGS